MAGYYLGVDIHKRFSQVAVMDRQGVVVEQRRVEHADREGLREYFARYAGSQVAMEATVGWPWMADELEGLGLRLRLAHPAAVPLIARSRLKSDQVDAQVLAHLLRTDFLPEAYLAPPEVRDRRELLRTRLGLVGMQTMVKNRVHGLLIRCGEFFPGSDLFGARGLAWLRAVELPPCKRQVLDLWLGVLEMIRERVQRLTKHLYRWLGEREEVRLLQTIPGVGPITAWTLLAEIGEIERFPSPKKLSAYAGLVPYTRQSAQKLWQDRLCKQGNAFLRAAMVEAAWAALRGDPGLGARFQGLTKRMGPQKAIIVIARTLLEIAFAVLSERRAYRPFALRRGRRLRATVAGPGSASPAL